MIAALALVLSTSGEPASAPVPRSLVPGGVYDKPFLTRTGRISIGGYADVQARVARADGVTEEVSIVPERINLFTFTPVSDRVRVATEIELEEAGEEVVIETALVDFEVHPSLTLRAGILLSPLGRFNLAHDSPANDLVARPLVSTELLAATLSEPGLGGWGAVNPTAASQVTWELYAVNGFDDGILLASPDGTRIAEGKGRVEDANAHPSLVGRVGLSPHPAVEVGLSGHRGPYNTWISDGVRVDRRRDLAIAALDLDVRWRDLAVLGEWARVWVDVPGSLSGVRASRQDGRWLEARWRFLRGRLAALPESSFGAAARVEHVDFDAGRRGDDLRSFTVGASFRPTEETVFKLDYRRAIERDRFALEVPTASLSLGIATYF